MSEDITVDPEVRMQVDVIREINRNSDIEHKYSYKRKRNHSDRKNTVDRYGFDNPEEMEDYEYEL